MKNCVVAFSICTLLLAGGARPAEGQQEPALSVRQYQLDSIESVGKAMADGCTGNYPALKPQKCQRRNANRQSATWL